jgi:hypothetical protein
MHIIYKAITDIYRELNTIKPHDATVPHIIASDLLDVQLQSDKA